MAWLTRIKDSLLSKIGKKIPKKDLEFVEKTRQEKKIKKIETNKEEILKTKKIEEEVHKEEQKKVELTQEPIKKKSWFQKLQSGLFKSSEKISQGVKKIFVNKKLDIQTLNDLEELLIMADIGPTVAEKLTAELANEKFDTNIKPEEVKNFLAKKIEEKLEEVAKPLVLDYIQKPIVVNLEKFEIINFWYYDKKSENYKLRKFLKFKILSRNVYIYLLNYKLNFFFKKKKNIKLEKNDLILFGPYINNHWHKIYDFLLRLILTLS